MPPLHDVEKPKQFNYDHICPNVQKNYDNASRESQDKAYFYVRILEKGKEEKKKKKIKGLVLYY